VVFEADIESTARKYLAESSAEMVTGSRSPATGNAVLAAPERNQGLRQGPVAEWLAVNQLQGIVL